MSKVRRFPTSTRQILAFLCNCMQSDPHGNGRILVVSSGQKLNWPGGLEPFESEDELYSGRFQLKLTRSSWHLSGADQLYLTSHRLISSARLSGAYLFGILRNPFQILLSSLLPFLQMSESAASPTCLSHCRHKTVAFAALESRSKHLDGAMSHRSS